MSSTSAGVLLSILLVAIGAPALATGAWSLDAPALVLEGVPFQLVVNGPDAGGPVVLLAGARCDTIRTAGRTLEVRLRSGETVRLVSTAGSELAHAAPRLLPGWTSILPPLLAIVLALVTRQVLVSLVVGAWIGCLLLVGGHPLTAFLRLGDTFIVDALADRDNATIVLFTTILGGMVGVMARAGLSDGLVQALAGRVGGRRGGQTATAAMGTVIFFDDYANTLLVGTTMRPLTDRLRISREKLAYLVDSTAAPVTTIAVISTWVGFEVGLIQDAMAALGDGSAAAYAFFLRTLPYAFYPWLTLLMVYLVASTGRDFGPMLAAERRATTRGELVRPGARPVSETLGAGPVRTEDGEQSPVHPALGLLPVITVVATTAVGLIVDGRRAAVAAGMADPGLRDFIGQANSFAVLMWASMLGALVALVLVVSLRRLDLRGAMDGFGDGCRAMLVALTILVLAWSLSAICKQLFTAPFLVEVCRGALSPRLLPGLVFVMAAVVSFATGTSWGTMAILLPLVYPLGALLPEAAGLAAGPAASIHLAAVSAVLAGAVFGDHCSPISDTTIMSSLASGSDHIDHVRTQMPYAALVGTLALACGYLPAGWGVSPWVGLFGGAGLLTATVLVFGRRPS